MGIWHEVAGLSVSAVGLALSGVNVTRMLRANPHPAVLVLGGLGALVVLAGFAFGSGDIRAGRRFRQRHPAD